MPLAGHTLQRQPKTVDRLEKLPALIGHNAPVSATDAGIRGPNEDSGLTLPLVRPAKCRPLSLLSRKSFFAEAFKKIVETVYSICRDGKEVFSGIYPNHTAGTAVCRRPDFEFCHRHGVVSCVE
jgi:hypothetical protein